VDARLDGPPTVARGRVVFGCHDGRVYCLDLADGALVWRFQAAHADRLISVHGQLASPWPVPSAVPVVGDLVIANAGHHPEADGGILLYGLDLASGAVRWRRVVTNERPEMRLPLDGTKRKTDIAQIFKTNRIANTVLVADQTVFHLMGRRFRVADGQDAADDHPEFAYMPRWNAVSAPNRRGSQQNLDGPGDSSPRWGVIGTSTLRVHREGRPPGKPSSASGRPVASDDQHLVVQMVGGSGGPTELQCYTRRAVSEGGAPLWSVDDALRAEDPHMWASGLVIAGARLIGTGAVFGPNEWLPSRGRLEIRAMADGRLLHHAALPAAPVDHGIAVVDGRIYLSLDNGTVICLE
jgi:outer membrane protein assembly factor BamB